MPTLYIAATPIGNLGDASPRLLETLAGCPVILCEDTRVTHKLFSAFGIPSPELISCHQHNEKGRAEQIAERMLAEQIDVCLVTDAGTPGVSDPGYAVVAAAVQRGIPVRAVAGPSAVAAAIGVCGFPVDRYTFYGFLPREGKERREALAAIGQNGHVAVMYESPFRVKALMKDLAAAFPDAQCSLSCDLTKVYELTIYGTPQTVLDALLANPNSEKGEYVLVMRLMKPKEADTSAVKVSARALLLDAALSGEEMRDAVKRISAMEGFTRNEVYKASLQVAELMREEEA